MQIRKSFVISAGVLLVVAVLVGGWLAYWIWKNLGAELLLRDQRASVVVPNPMSVGIDILDNLDIMIDTVIDTTVPVDQELTLPIKDTLNVMVTFDNEVPIKMNVPLDDVIKLDQVIPVDGKVQAKVMGKWITLPIKGDLPVKADVPVKLNVPVDQMVNLNFTAPAKVDFLDDLTVPLKTDIVTSIPLKSAMSVPVRSRLHAQATILEPADALLAEMDLRLPLRELGLSFGSGKKEEPAEAEYSAAENADEPALAEDEAPASAPVEVISEQVSARDEVADEDAEAAEEVQP